MRWDVAAILGASLLLGAASGPDDAVRAALAARLQLAKPPAGTVGWADLNGDGRDEALFLMSERDFCGSGGCAFYVLARDRSSWRIVSSSTITRAPIRVLEARSHGWRDLAVTVGGGGLPNGEVRLRFDGRRYPANPSLAPAAGPAAGRTLISE
jgi:hypothetical protein